MKKLLFAIIATFIILLTPTAAFAATLSLDPSTATFAPSCDFQVKILLDTQGAQTDGTDAILLFDANKITPSQFAVQNGSIYPDYANVVDGANGKIQISGIAAASQAYAGSGTLATVSFKVNSGASGPFQINFDFDQNNKANTTDSNVIERGTVSELLSSVTNGSYTASAGAGCAGGSSAGSTSTSTGTSGTSGSSGRSTSSGVYTVNNGAGVGAPGYQVGSGSGTVVYEQPVQYLNNAGSLNTTLVIAVVGGILIILGIIGLMVL